MRRVDSLEKTLMLGGIGAGLSKEGLFESYPAGDGSLESVKARVGHGQICDLERPLTVCGE